jgi:hypothetical protein
VAVIDRDKGAFHMAGLAVGASAPFNLAPGANARRTLHLPGGKTRTRLSHGAFPLGDLIASVYSSRRDSDGRVTLSVGRAALRLDVSMTPEQARAMARMFEVAARAAAAKSSTQQVGVGGAA